MQVIKGFLEVNEVDVLWGIPRQALLNNVSQDKYLACRPTLSSLSKTSLFLSQRGVNSCINSKKEDSAEDFQSY